MGIRAKAKIDSTLKQKLDAATKTKLETYAGERQPLFGKSQPVQAVVIATFLLDELSVDGISPDDLYTVNQAMGWPTASNPRAPIDNAKNRHQWFEPFSDGRASLSHKGENYGRFGSKADAEKARNKAK